MTGSEEWKIVWSWDNDFDSCRDRLLELGRLVTVEPEISPPQHLVVGMMPTSGTQGEDARNILQKSNLVSQFHSASFFYADIFHIALSATKQRRSRRLEFRLKTLYTYRRTHSKIRVGLNSPEHRITLNAPRMESMQHIVGYRQRSSLLGF